MTELFLTILQMSLMAAGVTVIVLPLRWLFRRLRLPHKPPIPAKMAAAPATSGTASSCGSIRPGTKRIIPRARQATLITRVRTRLRVRPLETVLRESVRCTLKTASISPV